MKLFKLIFFILFFLSSLYSKEITIDLNEISQNAAKEFKHTLLFFNMNHCPYCKKMEKFIFKDLNVKSEIENNFFFIDANIDDDDIVIYKKFKDTKKEFAHRLKVNFYPTVFFLDENNQIVYKAKGYTSKEKFINILRYIKSKSYTDKDLDTYLYENE